LKRLFFVFVKIKKFSLVILATLAGATFAFWAAIDRRKKESSKKTARLFLG
jgi:hypothetical protein